LLDRGTDAEAAAAPETVKIFAGNLSVRNPNSLSEPTAAVTEGNESDTYHRLDIYRRLEQGGYLVGSGSQSPVEHYVDRIFRPEVIHLGKASVACTLVTAIKHKDLLCLINPMVVWVSW
jgi:hypothetical protein